MPFAASRCKPARIYAHGNTRWQQSCSHSNEICNRRFKKRIELRTQTQPLVAEYRGGINRVRNGRSRNRRTNEVPFITGCSHFKRKNTRFRAPASSPTQPPCNIHAAITMRVAASRSKPASLYTHGNTRWQQSCSHSNAICNHRFKKRIELRTQTQPLVAEHRGGTNHIRNDRSRNRRTHEVPFIAGCSRFTRKNTRFRAPASSPTQAPCNMHAGQFFCDVLLCVKSHTTLHQGQVSQCYLSVTRKYCFPTSFDNDTTFTLHYTTLITLHYTTLHWMTLHYTYSYNCNCNCICNYTTLHYTTLITLHYTTLHYITLTTAATT